MTDKKKTPAKKSNDDPGAAGQSARLLRSSEDRLIAGVAGGLAKRLEVDPAYVRIGFVVAAFFAGFGVLAYLLLALILPADDGSGRPVPGNLGRGLLIAGMVAGGILVAGIITVLSAWTTATGHGAVIAGLVIALGIGVAATAFLDSRAAAPWLIGVALLMAVPAGAVAAADVRFDGGIGERDYRPLQAADIPADGYELGVGQLVVDLRDLPWQQGQTVALKSELGVGQMIVAVPPNVCVQADARAKAGEVLVRGSSSSGVDTGYDRSQPAGTAPRLDLDADLQLGQLVVTDQDPDRFDRDRHGDGDDPDEQARASEACAA